MAVWPAELEWLAGDPVFSVDELRFSWGDVLISAECRGALAELTRSTRRALGALRALSKRDEGPDSGEIRAEASRFRYAHKLLAAEDLDAWLVRWHLELADWTAYLARGLCLTRPQGELGEPEEDELSAAVAVDAICGGMLDREAYQLAADVVLFDPDKVSPGSDRHELIAQVVTGAARARRTLVDSSDIDREIGARALEWTRIDADVLEVADLDVAREAALCVRVDGRAIAEVAAQLGMSCERRAVYLEEAEQQRLPELLGARAGELVGPTPRNGSFLLVEVRERTRPNVADPELRERAAGYLVEQTVRRAVEARVRWT